jgi:hypothetical protein
MVKTMKNWIYKILIVAISSAAIFSCTPEIDVPTPTSGGADFSNYVAVGNSLTAGFADNGLYADGQANSFPAMIAEQMNSITPSDFIQPDIPGNGSGYIYLTSLDLSGATPDVEIGQFDADANWLNQIEGPFNNLGVPGIRVKDISVAGYGSSPQVNPYFYRMLGGKDPNSSYLSFVSESNPTFFTCWLGNNDVLGYATSGGAFGVDGLPGTGLNGLTNPDTEFKPSYDALINALTAGGAKGVLLTIPDITNIPFFTTVPWNGAELDQASADLANAFYAAGIDTAVENQVQEAVIELTVTEEAVKENVIPGVAQGAVYLEVYTQAFQAAKASGATDEEAHQLATAQADEYVATPEGQAAIAALIESLNAELQPHLLDMHANHEDLEEAYEQVDIQLDTNTALQAGIAQGIADLTLAYENEMLPPDQQAALEAAISEQTQQQIELLKAAGIYPVFQEGPNGFVIFVEQNESNPLGIRQMRAGEYMLLTALLDGQLNGLAALEPKPNQYVLTADEVANINSYRDAYNDVIRANASSGDIGLVESDELLEQVNSGIFQDGVTVNSDFITGGAFSLDAVHLTPRGYALVANAIIDEINSTFNARLSPVIINNHRAVVLP